VRIRLFAEFPLCGVFLYKQPPTTDKGTFGGFMEENEFNYIFLYSGGFSV
jgi:hypothetical protein